MQKKDEKKTGKSGGKRKSAIQLTRKEIAGWLLIFFLASFAFFTLGVFVGRRTAPVFDIDGLQKELADLKEEVLKKERSRIKIDSETKSYTNDLKFHEELKHSENNGNLNKNDNKKNKKPKSEKKVSEAKSNDTHTEASESGSLDYDRTPATKKTDKQEKYLTIQVAAFKDTKDAEQMVDSLKKKGYPAYMAIGKLSEDNIWYRVRIGEFKSKEEAGETIRMLKQDNMETILLYKSKEIK